MHINIILVNYRISLWIRFPTHPTASHSELRDSRYTILILLKKISMSVSGNRLSIYGTIPRDGLKIQFYTGNWLQIYGITTVSRPINTQLSAYNSVIKPLASTLTTHTTWISKPRHNMVRNQTFNNKSRN